MGGSPLCSSTRPTPYISAQFAFAHKYETLEESGVVGRSETVLFWTKYKKTKICKQFVRAVHGKFLSACNI